MLTTASLLIFSALNLLWTIVDKIQPFLLLLWSIIFLLNIIIDYIKKEEKSDTPLKTIIYAMSFSIFLFSSFSYLWTADIYAGRFHAM